MSAETPGSRGGRSSPSMDRLLRLLHLIPAATREHGVSLDQLAEELGVDRAVIEGDVQVLLDRAAYLTASRDGDLQIERSRDRIEIWTPGPFGRPPRLTRPEALALVLGLRSRALLRGRPPEESADRLLARLEDALGTGGAPDPGELPVEDASAAAPGARIRDRALDAVAGRRVLEVEYVRPGAEAPVSRRMHPAAVVHAEGRWYLLGRDPEAGGAAGGEGSGSTLLPADFRAFRLDRVLELKVTGERFPAFPDDVLEALAGEPRLFLGADVAREVPVVYSPRIARWIQERHEGEELPDGSLRVVHRVADREWLVRHVLQYAGEARAEGEAAAWIREAAGGRREADREPDPAEPGR